MNARRSPTPHAQFARWIVAAFFSAGCGGSNAPPPAPRPVVPLAIRRSETTLRVFQGEEDTPGTVYPFEGSPGNLRVTMEIGGSPGSTVDLPPSINDVLFNVVGVGRISVAFQRPWPDHPNGRVTLSCSSGEQVSSAEFEPELWQHQPGAIVSLETSTGDGANPVVAGKEVVLARYVARNLPRDIHLTFKALFTKDPVSPRTKAGIKPPR